MSQHAQAAQPVAVAAADAVFDGDKDPSEGENADGQQPQPLNQATPPVDPDCPGLQPPLPDGSID